MQDVYVCVCSVGKRCQNNAIFSRLERCSCALPRRQGGIEGGGDVAALSPTPRLNPDDAKLWTRSWGRRFIRRTSLKHRPCCNFTLGRSWGGSKKNKDGSRDAAIEPAPCVVASLPLWKHMHIALQPSMHAGPGIGDADFKNKGTRHRWY